MTAIEGDDGPALSLSPQDELIVEGLASGMNQRETADFAGVHPKTVQRRWADPTFAVLVAQRRAERAREVGGQLTEAATEAVAVLREAMGAEHPIKVRLVAAQATLRNARDHQAAENEARIADLERVVARLSPLLTEDQVP